MLPIYLVSNQFCFLNVLSRNYVFHILKHSQCYSSSDTLPLFYSDFGASHITRIREVFLSLQVKVEYKVGFWVERRDFGRRTPGGFVSTK